ncbi:porin family protein [Cereibacter changlensis]|uniref:Porin family protein n=1 Tax=Cereibacter changlensis TaxID=402884 RepID=A0A4U0YP29_9RHOB|nr:porin family protein [Cereibacter changlensis]TKA94170.1 porin family protein [Cereibacter changlensis]
MKRIAVLALGGLLAAPAFAGGPVEIAPEPIVAAPAPVVVEQSADWGGFYAGAQLGYGDISSDVDGDGALGGVHAGYRHDFGRMVLGGELDYDFSNIDIEDDTGLSGELDNVARIKLMAGADLGRSLLYVTAGKAYADASLGGTDYSDNGNFYGIGMDYAVTDTWTVGGEILKHEFDGFDDTAYDIDATTVKAKVSYNF